MVTADPAAGAAMVGCCCVFELLLWCNTRTALHLCFTQSLVLYTVVLPVSCYGAASQAAAAR